MAFSGTSTTSLSKMMQEYYEKRFLLRVENEMVAEQFGQQKPLPLYSGKTIRFQRYKNLSPQTTALTEGTLPSVTELSSEDVTATVAEYGTYTKVSRLVSKTALDPEIAGAVDIFGYNAARTRDRQIINVIGAYGTDQFTKSATNISELTNISDYVITTAEVRKALKTLRKNTAPLGESGYYMGIMSPEVEYDLEGDSDWVTAARYEGSTQLFKGEIGKWMGVRFVRSTEVYTQNLTGGADYDAGGVFTTHIFGRDAYGIVPLGKGKPQIYVKEPGPGDTSQPIPRYHTVGWMGTYTQVVLNANFLVNIKSRATGETSA